MQVESKFKVHNYENLGEGYRFHLDERISSEDDRELPHIMPFGVDHRFVPLDGRHKNAWFDVTVSIPQDGADESLDIGAERSVGTFENAIVEEDQRHDDVDVFVLVDETTGIHCGMTREDAPDWLAASDKCAITIELVYDEEMTEELEFHTTDIAESREEFRSTVERYNEKFDEDHSPDAIMTLDEE